MEPASPVGVPRPFALLQRADTSRPVKDQPLITGVNTADTFGKSCQTQVWLPEGWGRVGDLCWAPWQAHSGSEGLPQVLAPPSTVSWGDLGSPWNLLQILRCAFC